MALLLIYIIIYIDNLITMDGNIIKNNIKNNIKYYKIFYYCDVVIYN